VASRLFEVLLERRGVDADFLAPQYDNKWLCDTADLPDVDKAVKRLMQAREAGEKILIFGDYDVDGVTASIVMKECLETLGLTVVGVMLPDRFDEGYGMHEGVVVKAVELEATLVVTVDTGSSSEEVIEMLKKEGVETIVTDHHECAKPPKSAVAVVNPKRKDSKYPNRDLAGVGVAFKLMYALDKAVPLGERVVGWEKWSLDLVALGTVCDSMPLVGENRALVYWGMKVLERTRRTGLRVLMGEAGVNKVDTMSIGFMIGPRINAAGRMDSAYKAYGLLTEESTAKAVELAHGLNELNAERRNLQDKAFESACRKIEKTDAKVIAVKGKWNQGVIGIVAGKLTERYMRPSVVFTEKDGLLLGSARSFGDFDLAEAVSVCKDLLVVGGGHKYAAGLTVEKDNYELLVAKLNEYYLSLELKDQEKYLKREADVVLRGLDEMTVEFAHELRKLEPFGEGNPEVVVELSGMTVTDVRMMGRGGKHLALTVVDKGGLGMRLVKFSMPEEWDLHVGSVVDVTVVPRINSWRGIERVEGEILGIEVAS